MRSFNNCRTREDTVVSARCARRMSSSCSLRLTQVETEEPGSATCGRPRFPGGSVGDLFIGPYQVSTSRHPTAHPTTPRHATPLLDVTSHHNTAPSNQPRSHLDVRTRHDTPPQIGTRQTSAPEHHTPSHATSLHPSTSGHNSPRPHQFTPRRHGKTPHPRPPHASTTHFSASRHITTPQFIPAHCSSRLDATSHQVTPNALHITPRRHHIAHQHKARRHDRPNSLRRTTPLGVIPQHLTPRHTTAQLGVTSRRATSTARPRHPSARSLPATPTRSASAPTAGPAPCART